MTALRVERSNPSQLPDANYFALRRVIDASNAMATAGGGSEARAMRCPPTSPSRGIPCLTNRQVENQLTFRLGWNGSRGDSTVPKSWEIS